MEFTRNNLEQILSQSICGYRQYALGKPVRLVYVSENLCRMVGKSSVELMQPEKYVQLIHQEDRNRYCHFLEQLSSPGQMASEEYHLTGSGGRRLLVRDTATVLELGGQLFAQCVLTVLTEQEIPARPLRQLEKLKESLPWGVLCYTCERQPKITYMNRQMEELLRLPGNNEAEADYRSMCRENIFLMVPMEERRKFSLLLNRVYSEGFPLAGEMNLQRWDGSRVRVLGWVTKGRDIQGNAEFQSICIDVTEGYRSRRNKEAKRYLDALKDVYDKVFSYDLSAGTVQCLYSSHSSQFQWIENIPMEMGSATFQWIDQTVVPEDRQKVRGFFRDFWERKLQRTSQAPPQVSYQAQSSDGQIRRYRGILLQTEESVSLFCCRCVADQEEVAALRRENVMLRENMQELMRFSDGMAAFLVTDQGVTPLYASDNVCRFFGYSREQWLPLMQRVTPLEEFVSGSPVDSEDYRQLLRTGQAEFTYQDVDTGSPHRIKAICSPKLSGKSGPQYVMLYSMDQEKSVAGKESKEVFIRTFGYFDVFVGDRPIAFRHQKAKELFAILTDRRGGYVTSQEAIAFLWEDEPVNAVTLARYRKVALRLKNTLEEYGIADVLDSVDGKRRIVPEKVRCDLFCYLSGKPEYAQLFKGNYLTNYSWAETTLAELTGAILYAGDEH